MTPTDGFEIVLTADRTLTAPYPLMLDAMFVSSQTTAVPLPLIEHLMVPKAGRNGPRAATAPLGLRRIEAALIGGGFPDAGVAVVDERRLPEAVGPSTRVVAVSTGDPAGLGMHTTTTTRILGGRGVPQAAFEALMRSVRRACEACSRRPKVVAGGPGAWQLARSPEAMDRLGIDHVVTGYAEGNVADVFRAVAEGGGAPRVITGKPVDASRVPSVRGATTMGVVEISRGCGLGCAFCTIARTPMQHLPRETILADARTNVAGGNRNLCVISEDVFRYGGDGRRANPAALIDLLAGLRRIGGVGIIQTDHANVTSVEQYSDAQFGEVRRLMIGDSGQRRPWVNVGVETASGALLRANGGGPKMAPHGEADWPDACAEQLRRLCRVGFLPMASLVVGLPGESAGDVERTIAWVRSLGGEPITIFPEVYAPIGDARADVPELHRLHWRLIRECYKLNFRWFPRLYRDSQRAVGVGLARRSMLRALGWCEAARWMLMLAWRSHRSRPADDV